MFSWLTRDDGKSPELYDTVVEGLKKIYKTKLLPLEEAYQFHDFHSPKLDDPDFDAKPMILLVGQYSTGKTTFIKYLLEREFPGIRIGPEPTTDRFIAVMFDEKEGVIPGNALVVDPKKQFKPLTKFGNAFLNRFQCSTVNSPVLKGISIVDTPGILSGEKQRTDRGYDFTGVLEWFAERVDRIILLFDAHKLDISDEFRRSIEALRGHDDKIRIVLNKADMVDHQQLMRVYGALMWSLGKVLQTPEVARVYIGSFWDQPLRFDTNRRLFEDEEQDLFRDLQSLPRNATLRKLNDLIKRARLAKVHAYIISSLRKDMPSMFGKDGKKKELIKGLSGIYEQIQREHQISPGDFPDIKKMQECLSNHDFTKFNPLKPRLLEIVDKMLSEDISRLMAQIPHEDVVQAPANLHGGAFEGVEDTVSPFGYKRGEGIDAGHGEPEWIVNKMRYKYDGIFESLGPINGKVSGEAAKTEMVKSKLPKPVLGKIWKLADIDKDGFLDNDEFALAMHLIQVKLDGHDLPPMLPDHLIPPSKRSCNEPNRPEGATLRKHYVASSPKRAAPPAPKIVVQSDVKKNLMPVPSASDCQNETVSNGDSESQVSNAGHIEAPNEGETGLESCETAHSNSEIVNQNGDSSSEGENDVGHCNGAASGNEVDTVLPIPSDASTVLSNGDTSENEDAPTTPSPRSTVVLKHKVGPDGALRSYFESCAD